MTISGDRAPYAVTAAYRGLSAQGLFAEDLTQPAWQKTLAILSDPRRPPGEDQLIQTGSRLFEALIQGDVWELWVEARADLSEPSARDLRLRLLLHPPAVAALPWESFYDPKRQQPFGADASVALVRVANQVGFVGRPRPLETALPLKILVVAVEDPGGIDTQQELTAVAQILAPLQPQRLVLRQIGGRLDVHTLRRILLAERPDILHLIGHGQPDGLVLWSANGDPTLVSSGQLAATLRQVDSLKLVFLNACLAGQADGDASFGNVALRLLQTGIPAVIAMQFEIADRAAIEFAGFLYEALVAGDCPGAVDRATSVARTNLYISDPGRLGYVTPVLWLNSIDGVIAHLTREVAESHSTRDRAGEQESRNAEAGRRRGAEQPSIDIQIDEKERWFQALPESIAPIGMRFDYQHRRQNLQGLLVQLRRDQKTLDAGDPVDARRLITRLEIFDTERKYLDNLLRKLDSSSS